MSTTVKERLAVHDRLSRLGIGFEDACQLRRIAMQLHRWFEMECGDENGCIERDEASGKAYWLNATTMKRSPIADREKGAMVRLGKLMSKLEGQGLVHYVQTDPRGASLYILRAEDVTGHEIDQVYNRGVAVY